MADENFEKSLPFATARGMLYITVGNLFATVSGSLFFIFIARFLPSVSDLGFVTGIQTVIGMYVILSSLGLAPSAIRFISAFMGAGEQDRATALYPLIFLIVFCSSGGFSIFLYFISPYLSVYLFHNSSYTILIELTSVDVFFFSIVTASMYLLYASSEFKKSTMISLINSILKFPISFLLLASGLGLQGLILGLVLGDGITFILCIYTLLPKILVKRKLILTAVSELKPFFKYALPIYGSMILNFLSTKIDIYLLLILSTLYVVGVYSPAVFIASIFFILIAAMDQALLPLTARLFGKSGMKSFKFTSKTISRYLFLIYFPMGFAIAASAPSLIVLILGDRYYDSAYPTAIIIIAMTLTSMSSVFSNLLRSSGYPGVILKAQSLALVVQTIVIISTIGYFGIIGAAAARAASRSIFLIYPAHKLYKLGGLDYDRKALVNALVGSSIICIIIIVINTLTEQIYFLLVSYVIAVLAYLIYLRVIHAVNSKDIEILDKILLGRLNRFTRLLAKLLIAKQNGTAGSSE